LHRAYCSISLSRSLQLGSAQQKAIQLCRASICIRSNMQAAIVSTAAAPPIAGRTGAWKHQRPVACRRTGTQRQVKHCQQVYVRAAAGADNKTAANGNGNGNGAVARVAIPTRLNTIPHERTTRQFFYQQTTAGILKAVAAGETRISAR
jgi:hypothetical protein